MRNNLKIKKISYLFFILILLSSSIVCQEEEGNGVVVDYYGVISKDLDNNMSKMISDLYYTQLSEIPNFTVYDKRTKANNTVPTIDDIFDSTNNIFYTEIKKNEDEENWSLSYILIESVSKHTFSKQKVYDSFYKILMESKNELEDSIKELLSKKDNLPLTNTVDEAAKRKANLLQAMAEEAGSVATDKTETKQKLHIKSLEMLSGTWKGEQYIDKIVILRGGRGFVIYENGASMNITVTIEETETEQKIIIKQKGQSNASFYPELPRKVALTAAVSAPPIEWTMTLLDNMVLEGIKTTIAPDNDSFKISKESVSWEKIS